MDPGTQRLRLARPLLGLAALFVLAGGWVHLRDWAELYRKLPNQIPGVWVVKEGFLANVVASLVFAAAIAFVALRQTKRTNLVLAAVAGFQLSSLAVLILSRTGSVAGWNESTWTLGANQARAVEIGALLCLAAAAVVLHGRRMTPVRLVADAPKH